MHIHVTLNLDEKLKELDISKVENPLARGWVEINEAIKFPVRVMKYTDKEDGRVKAFVSLPQRKNGEKYEEVVHPVSNEIRDEVQNAVLAELENALTNQVILNEHVTDVRVNLLKEPVRTGSIQLVAMASITLCGFRINGIQIKESGKGTFVQMPQHKAGNEYRDTIYGTTAPVQQEIREKVLKAYEDAAAKKKVQPIPPQSQESDKSTVLQEMESKPAELQAPVSTPKRHHF